MKLTPPTPTPPIATDQSKVFPKLYDLQRIFAAEAIPKQCDVRYQGTLSTPLVLTS